MITVRCFGGRQDEHLLSGGFTLVYPTRLLVSVTGNEVDVIPDVASGFQRRNCCSLVKRGKMPLPNGVRVTADGYESALQNAHNLETSLNIGSRAENLLREVGNVVLYALLLAELRPAEVQSVLDINAQEQCPYALTKISGRYFVMKDDEVNMLEELVLYLIRRF